MNNISDKDNVMNLLQKFNSYSITHQNVIHIVSPHCDIKCLTNLYWKLIEEIL